MSRLENSAKNIVFSFGNTILASILGFISKRQHQLGRRSRRQCRNGQEAV